MRWLCLKQMWSRSWTAFWRLCSEEDTMNIACAMRKSVSWFHTNPKRDMLSSKKFCSCSLSEFICGRVRDHHIRQVYVHCNPQYRHFIWKWVSSIVYACLRKSQNEVREWPTQYYWATKGKTARTLLLEAYY